MVFMSLNATYAIVNTHVGREMKTQCEYLTNSFHHNIRQQLNSSYDLHMKLYIK
jgi:hypothetical protein